MSENLAIIKTDQIEPDQPKVNREAFWKFCRAAAYRAIYRSATWGLPCDVDADYLDSLLVDQQWCCAVTGIPLEAGLQGSPDYALDRLRLIRNMAILARTRMIEELGCSSAVERLAVNEDGGGSNPPTPANAD